LCEHFVHFFAYQDDWIGGRWQKEMMLEGVSTMLHLQLWKSATVCVIGPMRTRQWKRNTGGREFLKGDATVPEEQRVGAQPFNVLHERRQSALLYEIASPKLRKRRVTQLKADLLVMEMMLARMQPIVDGDTKRQ
jgi:hypothetical protein